MTADTAGRQGLAKFLARFDRGEYWLAHEELETLWLESPRPAYKGLIHLAAACLHWERDNRRGAATKLRSARTHVEQDRHSLPEFDVDGLLAEIRRLEAALEAGEVFERVRLAPLASVALAAVSETALPYRVTRYAQGYRPGRDPRRRD